MTLIQVIIIYDISFSRKTGIALLGNSTIILEKNKLDLAIWRNNPKEG